MGYLCNGESAIAACDSYNWPTHRHRQSNPTTATTRRHHHKHRSRVQDQGIGPAGSFQLRPFSFSDLESATGGFSPRTLLGKGSHSAVYRASLDGGKLIAAVKRTKSPSDNELEILSSIRSPRIVNLIGYAADPTTKPRKQHLLVIEHMPGGSLYDLIHRNPRLPGWSTRVWIALQVAKAVRVIHGSDPPVIHRDIKSSNVMMDGRGSARLSDFGLALRGSAEDVRVMSTPPAGTLGYLDPCYLTPGDLSTKSDVFSFGILLLEIVSGRRAIDVDYSPASVVEWALPLIKSGSYREIFDRRIGSRPDPTVCRELGIVAARCVRSTVEKRPSMVEVVDWLEAIYKRMQAPIWNGVRRRVGRVGEPVALVRLGSLKECGDDAHGVRIPRRRSLSRDRRVSSVGEETAEVTGGGNRMVRSKSDGCCGDRGAVGSRSPAERGTGAAVKLGKSMSVGRRERTRNQQG